MIALVVDKWIEGYWYLSSKIVCCYRLMTVLVLIQYTLLNLRDIIILLLRLTIIRPQSWYPIIWYDMTDGIATLLPWMLLMMISHSRSYTYLLYITSIIHLYIIDIIYEVIVVSYLTIPAYRIFPTNRRRKCFEVQKSERVTHYK